MFEWLFGKRENKNRNMPMTAEAKRHMYSAMCSSCGSHNFKYSKTSQFHSLYLMKWLSENSCCAPIDLPSGGAVIFDEDLKWEHMKEKMGAAHIIIEKHLEKQIDILQAQFLPFSYEYALEPMEQIEEHFQGIDNERIRYMGYAVGRHFNGGAVQSGLAFTYESMVVDFCGIDGSAVRDICSDIGQLLEQDKVLVLERTKERSYVLTIT